MSRRTKFQHSLYAWNNLSSDVACRSVDAGLERQLLFGQFDGLSPEDGQAAVLALTRLIDAVAGANPGMPVNAALNYLRGLQAHILRRQAQGLPDWPLVS
jgi:hypothetical protein